MTTQAIYVREAVGRRLAHDITKINPCKVKGCYFKKGHLVQEGDIPDFLDLGKEHIYVLDIKDDEIHEDDAVLLLAQSLAGRGVAFDPNPSEGKISFTAAADGLLKVKAGTLESFNLLGEVMCATRHTNTVVKQGDVIGGTRAIPLIVKRDLIGKAVEIAGSGAGTLEVVPLKSARAALLITGNEVYTGRI
ncbi:MAG: molybdopterin-binding protein, partial [Actinomycetota bacterium]